MKNPVVATLLIAAALFSCSDAPEVSTPFPNYLTEEVDWIIYEGILPAENGQELLAELYLVPGTPGMDAPYKLTESIITQRFAGITTSKGKYTVLFGSPGHNIIRLNDKTMMNSIGTNKEFSRKDRITENLHLKSNGNHELVLVDKDLQVINPRYRLVRRSELFTVEGYFTVDNDTSEYFERNTLKKWPVAQLGYYNEAVKKYRLLAREKFEGIYLKALSYSVSHVDKNGNEVEALVFKRILKMDSTGGVFYP